MLFSSSKGNTTRQTDEVGNKTEYTYDSKHKLFVLTKRLPKYFAAGACGSTDTRFVETYTWNLTCQKKATSTDINDLETLYTYDALCRQTREDRPGNDFTITAYLNFGDPATQYIRHQRPSADGVYALLEFAYFDGLNRTWKEQKSAPDQTPYIRTVTQYNERGQKKWQTAPYYGSPDPSYPTTFTYDTLDRVIDTRLPDNTHVLNDYGIAAAGDPDAPAGAFDWIDTTDENGVTTRIYRDAWTRPLRNIQDTASQKIRTDVTWDLLGRYTGVLDHLGKSWTYNYDSVDRRTSVSDPDLGTWSYQYDARGRLTRQTDAKSQVTNLTYDSMDRTCLKTLDAGGSSQEFVTNTYDQARSGFNNVGERTTATRGVSQTTADITREFDHGVQRRLMRESWKFGTGPRYDLAHTYRINGLAEKQTFPDGDIARTVYNAAGNVKQLVDDATSGLLVTDTQYNARGQVTSVSYSNGAATTYDYDAAAGVQADGARGWLMGVKVTKDTTTILDLAYTVTHTSLSSR